VKKFLSVLLSVVLMLNLFPALVFAEKVTQMEIGTEYTVSISSSEDYETFSFVPDVTGTYVFRSTGECEPEIALFDEDYNQLGVACYGAEAEDDWYNFKFEYSYLYAGQTYYCEVYLPFEESAEFGIYVDYGDEYGEYEYEREITGQITDIYKGYYGICDWNNSHMYYYLPDDSLGVDLYLGDEYIFTISAETNTIVAVEELPPYYDMTIGYMSGFESTTNDSGETVLYGDFCFEDVVEQYVIYCYDEYDTNEIIEEFSDYTGWVACHTGDEIYYIEKIESVEQTITNAVYNNGFEGLEYEITDDTFVFNKATLELTGENLPLIFTNGLSYNVSVISYNRDGTAAVVLAECLNNTELVCGSIVTATVGVGETSYLSFVPKEDGAYKFTSSGDGDYYTYLYDNSREKTIDAYYDAEYVYYNMKANNTYTFEIESDYYNSEDISVSVSVEKVSDGCASYELIGGIGDVSNTEISVYSEDATYTFKIPSDTDIDFEQYIGVIVEGYYAISIDEENVITGLVAMPEYSEYEIGYLTYVSSYNYYCRILTNDYTNYDLANRVYVDGTRYYNDGVSEQLSGYKDVILFKTNSSGEIIEIITEINYPQAFTGEYIKETNTFEGIEYDITEDTMIFNASDINGDEIYRILDGNKYDVSVVAVDRYGNARAVVVEYNSGNMGELTCVGTHERSSRKIYVDCEYRTHSNNEGTCYVAMYTDGRLEQVKSFPVCEETGESLSFDIDIENIQEYYTFKCFCWDSNMSPMSKTDEFIVDVITGNEEIISIEMGTECAVQTTPYEAYKTFSFVPEASGTYTFYSTGECEPQFNLYDSEWILLAEACYGADDEKNVRLEYSYLTAGETYYIDTFLPSAESGEFGVGVDYGDEYGEYGVSRDITGMLASTSDGGYYGIKDSETGHRFYYLLDDSLDVDLYLGNEYVFTISAETNTIVDVAVIIE